MVEPQSPNQSDDLDRLLEDFEKQWRTGPAPEIEAFLEDLSENARSSLLPDLVELDQEYRWKQFLSDDDSQTKPVLLKEYGQRFPELGAVAQFNWALIVREFQGRLSTSEEITCEQFVAEYDLTDETLIKRLDQLELEKQAALPPQIPGYDQIEPLGQGGMGVVYRARQKRMKRPVAIKLIPAHLHGNADLRKRFEREMQAAAALNHNHIVTAYHADEYQQMLYLVSELADGENLSNIIREQGPFSVERAVSVMLQIAEGLSHAHQRGVIHRDIKPGNLIYNQQKNYVQILDFGLAKFRDQSQLEDDTSSLSPDLTSTGAIMGTVNYMAPEQAVDTKAADERSDIYSLGCVLHFLLTGEPPFGGSSLMSRLLAHREQPIPDLSQARPEIPDELNSIFSRMIAKDPQDRYASMDELISAFSELGIALDEQEPTLISQEQNSPLKETLVNATTVIMPESTRSQRRNVFLAIGVLGFLSFIGIAFKNSWQAESVTSPETELPSEKSPIQPAPATGSVVEKSPVTVPAQVPAEDDLPLLEEWLKGRKILTVAQDGSGQFDTIQSALLALKAGQAVEILDQGPYRETLRFESFPANTGLVSRVGTVLVLDTIRENTIHKGRYFGHAFNNINGFRLSGIFFSRGNHQQDIDLVSIGPSQDITVDSCHFEPPAPAAFNALQAGEIQHFIGLTISGSKQIEISRCILGSSARVSIQDETQLSLKHNWFQPGFGSQLAIDTPPHDAVKESCEIDITSNVFEQTKYRSIHCGLRANMDLALSIQQNTFHGGEAIVFFSNIYDQPVVIQKNVFLGNTQPLWFSINAMPDFQVLPDHWRILDNVYNNDYDIGKIILRSADGNVIIQTSSYLASLNDPEHYLRYKVSNAADTVPADCGAYPPGPAPPEGDWLTKLIKRWDLARRFNSDAETDELKDWLAGRTIRTVSQDGRGEFKSIQTALEALKPGEVVEVLDRGPYRETLRLGSVPANTGLVSRAGTVLALDTIHDSPQQKGRYSGHALNNIKGFRLSGIYFSRGGHRRDASLVGIGPSQDVTVDHCVFEAPPSVAFDNTHQYSKRHYSYGLSVSGSKSMQISHCIMGSTAAFWLLDETQLSLKHNWFQTGLVDQLTVGPFSDELKGLCQIDIESNVFEQTRLRCLTLGLLTNTDLALSIQQNTFHGGEAIIFSSDLSHHPVKIQKNVFRGNTKSMWFSDNAKTDLDALPAKWRITDNMFFRDYHITKALLRPEDGNVKIETGSYLASLNDPAHFLRYKVSNAADTAPADCGAYPPGPAPPEGDWLTQLIERWKFARPFISEAETEDLEDWLAGRTIRTVSQDGKGEFKSIQTALEALEPGEVVEVLDQGPYQEKIYTEERPLPKNIGLISRVGTMIKTPEWNTVPHPQGHQNIYGHNLITAGSFRLQGFDFEMEHSIPNARLVTVNVTDKKQPSYVVVTNCVFQAPENAPATDQLKGLLVGSSGEVHITNNLFVSAAELDLFGNTILAVDQNWFLGEHVQLAVRGYEDDDAPTISAMIAENVFDSPGENSILLQEIGSTNQISKIFHNTFFHSGRQPLIIRNGFEQKKTEIFQNLFLSDQDPILFSPRMQPDQAAIKVHWLVEQNVYSKQPGSRSISIEEKVEIVNDVSVLSETRDSPEYLHISDESPLAGATDQPGEWLPVIGAMMPDSVSADNDWFSELQAKWKKISKKP